MSDVLVSSAQPRRSWVGRFFGVIAQSRTWKNMAYLALAFPLALFYLVFLIVGLALGIGLVIIWVGLPILAVVVLAWWAFASFERLQAEYLLGVHTAGRLAPWEGDESWWQRVKRHLGDSRTWKDLAFLFVKFPLGVVSFVIVVLVVVVPTALVSAPLYYRYTHWTTNGVSHYGVNLGAWHVDTLGEALLLVPIGALIFFACLHLANAFARFSGILAAALLDEPEAAPVSPPATPPAPPTVEGSAAHGPATPQTAQAPGGPRAEAEAFASYPAGLSTPASASARREPPSETAAFRGPEPLTQPPDGPQAPEPAPQPPAPPSPGEPSEAGH